MKILVTGGAGFIGSNFVRWLLDGEGKDFGSHSVVVLDALTYAGNLANLDGLEHRSDYRFFKGDIRDRELVSRIVSEQKIDAVVNFAAESHVDRSIVDSLSFVRTNVEGTQVLLDVARELGVSRFLQVSTDEVYGSLGPEGRFVETTPLHPNSPYSASKAAADLLVLASYSTFGLPVLVSRCSNNYGSFQFPEKLIPLFITNALNDEPLPLYGDGKNVRSWLHVDDHSRALMLILERGRVGEIYNVGGACESEVENAFVTTEILRILDKPPTLVRYVEDRLGHDRRYAVDYSKIKAELGWEPRIDFKSGLLKTVSWYIENQHWWKAVKSGEYKDFYARYYGQRLDTCAVGE
ncbi:MAG: dTDP-glucose 4,6-dehydratase [Deltaproteobacteria bacterium]|nr:dTDP-glucose 4,6-dehydratase [Deltaproteobacteria bacterium]